MAAAAAEGPRAEGPKGWGRCGRSGRVTGCWGKVGGGGGSGGKWGQLPEKYKNKIKSSVASTKFFCSSPWDLSTKPRLGEKRLHFLISLETRTR